MTGTKVGTLPLNVELSDPEELPPVITADVPPVSPEIEPDAAAEAAEA